MKNEICGCPCVVDNMKEENYNVRDEKGRFCKAKYPVPKYPTVGEWIKKEDILHELREPVYMMANKAYHFLGETTHDGGWDVCIIFKELKDFYVGNYVFGYGFIDVKFPKQFVRDLTNQEKDKFGITKYGYVPFLLT